MGIKMIVTDLDGTFLHSDETLPMNMLQLSRIGVAVGNAKQSRLSYG